MKNFFEENITGIHLFCLELFILPIFIILNNIYLRLSLVLIYLFFAKLNKKKVSLMYFLTMFTSIVFFNLLMPNGELLLKFWFIKVTKGALKDGVLHGLLIIGLVFISLFCSQKDLKIPSKIGMLLSQTLLYYQLILDKKKNKIKTGTILQDVDNFLDQIYSYEATKNENIKRKTTKKGYAFIFLVILLNMLFLSIFIAMNNLEKNLK